MSNPTKRVTQRVCDIQQLGIHPQPFQSFVLKLSATRDTVTLLQRTYNANLFKVSLALHPTQTYASVGERSTQKIFRSITLQGVEYRVQLADGPYSLLSGDD
jgi:hypothetical protein